MVLEFRFKKFLDWDSVIYYWVTLQFKFKDTIMTNLKESLCIIRGMNISEQFDRIAKELFQKYQIVKNDSVYDLLEIEFYYCSSDHKDIITYQRTTKGGLWFFHPSGVDITFQSESDKYYGGILIRSIKKQGGKAICGPLKCVDELFDVFDTEDDEFNKKVMPKLFVRDNVDLEIRKAKRWILDGEKKITKKCEKLDFCMYLTDCKKFLGLPYRYFVCTDSAGESVADWDEVKKGKYAASPWHANVKSNSLGNDMLI